MSDHRCPDDPMGAMFHVMALDPDTGETYDVGPILDCSPDVCFRWDQWMVCSIRCYHGTFQADACSVNFAESFAAAIEKFNAYDHTEPLPPRNEDEDWADHRARLDAGRATIVEFCEAHGRRIHSDGFDYDPMHQGLVHKVDVHDDDGSRCTPVYAGLEWNAEFAAEVSYCSVNETGKRTDLTTTAYLTVQYWHQYWDNNLRL